MRYTWCLLLFTFCTTEGLTQSNYAVIDDPDGYLNVRQEAGTQHPVVGKIKEAEVFWISEEGSPNDWYYVNFMLPISDGMDASKLQHTLDGRALRSGYVHGSRVRRLPAPERDFITNVDLSADNFLAKDSILVYMNIGRYQPKDSVALQASWGTDLTTPKTKITQAYLKVHEMRHYLPSKGFFEPKFASTELIYDPQLKDFFITMNNSDGAGYYFCVWQVREDGEVIRYAFQPY